MCVTDFELRNHQPEDEMEICGFASASDISYWLLVLPTTTLLSVQPQDTIADDDDLCEICVQHGVCTYVRVLGNHAIDDLAEMRVHAQEDGSIRCG